MYTQHEGNHSTEWLRMVMAMEMAIARLEGVAQEQVRKKANIEQRWLRNLRQYMRRYEADFEHDLALSGRSRIFVGLTKQKTDGWEARLSDMLFPTDDRNWGIKPTPVPEMVTVAENAQEQPVEPTPEDGNREEGGEEGREEGRDNTVAEATKRAEAMESEIDDQFSEANFGKKCRDVIRDACLFGTGILKGPVTSNKTMHKWGPTMVGPAQGTWVRAEVLDPRPDFLRIDPWNFFPDMGAATVEDAEFFFERHLLTQKELRKLAKVRGFHADAIRDLLKEDGLTGETPPYLAQLREISGVGAGRESPKYTVWEYHGLLEKEELLNLCACTGKEDLQEVFAEDPLHEIPVILWFCQGKLLKFAEHPLDSKEPLYAVFNLERNHDSIFGNGVPQMMQDSQSSLNAAWRMILDNAGHSAMPQIVVDRKNLKPVDRSWQVKPGKMWEKTGHGQPGNAAFEMFHVTGQQNELAQIVQMAAKFADDETSLPLVAQGESATHQTTTAHGMSMLMNSVNVIFRRVVKDYDDTLTIPVVRRAYEWNMQFSDKDEIKGDFSVDARGSSVLLVKEMQSQNLMNVLVQFSAHPVLGNLIKTPALFRKLIQSYALSADEVVKSDPELAEEARSAQKQPPPPPDPQQVQAETQLKVAQLNAENRLQVAQLNFQTAQMKLAAEQGISLDKIRAQMADSQANREHKERQTAVEIAMTEKFGPSGGGIL